MTPKEMKKEIRKKVYAVSGKMTEAERFLSDEKIIGQLLSFSFYQEAQTIFCYVGVRKEIRTLHFISSALSGGKRVGVPLCGENGQMTVHEIQSPLDLEEGQWGLLEPKKHCPEIFPEEIDLAVVPCLCCNVSGMRLGQGGGFYDRYFSGKSMMKAALCRETFLFPTLPMEPFDQKMDFVITENQIIRH